MRKTMNRGQRAAEEEAAAAAVGTAAPAEAVEEAAEEERTSWAFDTNVATLRFDHVVPKLLVQFVFVVGPGFGRHASDGCVCLAALDVAEEVRGYMLWANNMVTERSNDFSAAVMEANPMPIQKQPC